MNRSYLDVDDATDMVVWVVGDEFVVLVILQHVVLGLLVKLRDPDVDIMGKVDDWDGGVDVTVELVDEVTGQISTLTILESNVTDPRKANTPPFETAAVSSVTEIAARIVPAKALPVPRVAEEPTCQYTMHGKAPPPNTIFEPEAETKVLPI
jgi:hypothetical protein